MTQIYVGNLSYTTSEPELRSLFGRYGRVNSIRMMTDVSTGRPRGFAFVTMTRLDDADEAIVRLNGSQLSGRTMVVNEANDDGKKDERSSDRGLVISRLNLM